ncbi:hypothetical protein BDZ94DRAFT_1247341 [Collybia nuda]|uniref:F-box domain-containing protein n=1 Tax=Collybia nuda TaxID=64659 RepID=A0A9P6CPM9_9AGAR|nr:hypothetical protein BDZ94DRAFT_1247341 [Collybia nuda]
MAGSPLEQTALLLGTLQARRASLLHEVERVERELGEVQARHARLLNENAPISKLPHELLGTIFYMCLGTWVMNPSKSRGKPFQVAASHVSHHWRETALGTPLLWNFIDLTVTQRKNVKENALQWFLAHLARSRDSFLHISLEISLNEAAHQFLFPLVQHSSRWRHLFISLTQGKLDDIHTLFSSASAPGLIHLSLRIGNHSESANAPRTEYPAICYPILKGGTPALNSVRLSGKILGNISPPLSAVTTLFVEAFPKNLISYSQFRALLASVPYIINLSLSGLNIHLPRDPLTDSNPFCLPTLRSFRLHGNATPVHRLLSFLSLPNLESLTLLSADSFDSATLPSVRAVILESCDFNTDEVYNLCRAFPGVTDLSADGTLQELFSLLEENISFWPNLITVSHGQKAKKSCNVYALTNGAAP